MLPHQVVSEHPDLAALYIEHYLALMQKEQAEQRIAAINQAIAQQLQLIQSAQPAESDPA